MIIKIIEYIRNNKNITKLHVIKKFGLTSYEAKYILRKLREKGIIKSYPNLDNMSLVCVKLIDNNFDTNKLLDYFPNLENNKYMEIVEK